MDNYTDWVDPTPEEAAESARKTRELIQKTEERLNVLAKQKGFLCSTDIIDIMWEEFGVPYRKPTCYFRIKECDEK